ncbi:MAG: hypothetical protein ACRDOE_20555, partial [Streptosporangiaceae bacterium]
MTWYPPAVGTADTILFVVRLFVPSMAVVLWYTQVSPTATGNGIEAGATMEFEVTLEVPPLAPEPGASLASAAVAPVEVLLDAPTPMLTSGWAPLPDPPHPARAATPSAVRAVRAAPTITVLADLYV